MQNNFIHHHHQEVMSPTRDEKKAEVFAQQANYDLKNRRSAQLANSGGNRDVDYNIQASPDRVQSNQQEQQQLRVVVNSYRLIGDKYLLLDNVEGSSSMYQCVDYSTREDYVCKVVSCESHSMVDAHYRMDSCPRVAALHEVIIEDKYMYLIFPKTYGDLHSYVRARKRLRESEAKRLFKQIVETVEVCHGNGIVLRDLKLRKFVFTDPQRTQLRLESLEDAVVLDDPDNDLLHDKRGCPAYVSPEILKVGANYSGRAADMWSLGVIMYTMLVGRYPFNDPDHTVLFAKIIKGHFVIPECISSRARCLIRSLLRKEPTERLVSEDIAYHPWLAKEDRDWQSRTCDQLVPDSCLYDDEDEK